MKPALIFLAFALCSSAVATENHSISTTRGRGISIEIVAVYDQTPPNGVMPFFVNIQNNGKTRGKWQVAVKIPPWQSKVQAVESFEVEAGQSRSYLINVPVPLQQHTPAESQGYSIDISGTGMTLQNVYSGTSRWGGSTRVSEQFILLVGEASEKTWGAIEDAKNASGEALTGSRVDLAAIPDNPISLSGVNGIWITPEDYSKFSAGQSAAVLSWIARGGELHITGTSLPSALETLRRGEGTVRHGLGTIHTADFEAGIPMAEHIVAHVKNIPPHLEKLPPPEPPLIKAYVKKPNTPVIAIMLFSVLFAAVIGPINLFVLAKRGKRHLLFFTTPAISLIASGIMLGIIIFGDGVGGEGARVGFVFSLPSQNEMQIYQHQRSRTGVLTRTGFSIPERSYTRQIPRYGSGFNQHNDPSELFVTGTKHSGDWFRSRSVPEQVIESAIPSRARIELTSTAPLTVVSSFDVTLEPFFYRDESGGLWKADRLAQGRRTELVASTEQEVTAFLEDCAHAGERIHQSLTAASSLPGYFVGTVTKPSDIFIPTLSSISWNKEQCYFAGEVAR